MTAALFAHQGGWDEIAMVLVPIAIFAGLLVVANRRANSIERARDRSGDEGDDHGGRDPHRDGPATR